MCNLNTIIGTWQQESFGNNHGDSTKNIQPGFSVMKNPKRSQKIMSKAFIFIMIMKMLGASVRKMILDSNIAIWKIHK